MENDLTREERTEDVEPETETKPAESQETTPQPKPEDTVEFWKDKATHQGQENIILLDKIKQSESQQELTKEPTDSDLRTAFPLWDSYDDVQKDFAKRTFGAERTAGNAAQIVQQFQRQSSWNTSIELVLTSNPALQGKEQAFRQFASQPKYQGVDMTLLIDAFLHKNPVAPTTRVTPKPGLEPGGGGPRTPEKPQGLSAEALSALRTSDYKAYEQYIKTHDITIEV